MKKRLISSPNTNLIQSIVRSLVELDLGDVPPIKEFINEAVETINSLDIERIDNVTYFVLKGRGYTFTQDEALSKKFRAINEEKSAFG